MNSQIYEKLTHLAARAEIADIEKRDKGMSLFVIAFKKEHGRRPTDEECQRRIEELKKKLQ